MASIELITKEDLEELKALIMGYAKPLMSVEEVANYLRLSPHTIRHKIADKTFLLGVHYSDKAGKILFAKEKLDTWILGNNSGVKQCQYSKKTIGCG